MGLTNQGVTPGRTTLLQAVNAMLTTIGEMPLDSLEREQVGDARIAESTLLELHREGQLRAWCWNTEYDYPFEVDKGTREIVLPANVVRFTVNPYQWDGRFILRGQRVYDRVLRSYKMADDLTEIRAEVVWQLAWDECPEAFNRWVTMRAARVFAARALGSDATVKLAAYDEQAAMTELMRMEIDQQRPNSLTDGPGLRPFPTYVAGYGLLRGTTGGHFIG